jgi:hypothetical protein
MLDIRDADWSPTDGRERWGLSLILGFLVIVELDSVDGEMADGNVA